MFDKKAYWERRKAGKRGQEDLSPITVTRIKGMKGAINRARSRRKFVDRSATHKGFVYGVKIGSKPHGILLTAKKKFAKLHKGERVPSEEQRRHLELHPLHYPPTKTNKQRFTERKEARDARRSAKTTAV